MTAIEALVNQKIFHITFYDFPDDSDNEEDMIMSGKAFIIKNWNQEKEEDDITFENYCLELELEYGTLDFCGYHTSNDLFTLGYDSNEIEAKNRNKVMNLLRDYYINRGYNVTSVFDYEPINGHENDDYEHFADVIWKATAQHAINEYMKIR